MLERFGLGFAGQGDGGFMGPVDDKNLRALLDEPEDGGSGRAPGAEDGDARALEPEALFERPDDAGNVGIEADDLAIGADPQGIAGADLGSQRVPVGEVGKHLFLERHGDGYAREGQFADQGQQVFEGAGLQGKKDGVHALPAEGGRVHERGKRVGDGVAGDAKDASGLIQLIEPV